MSWVVFDLDGTLFNCTHRVHLAQQKRWDDFHEGIPFDKTYPETEFVFRAISPFCKILLCTGRPESSRPVTERMMQDRKLRHNALLMRPEGDFTPDHELKPKLVKTFFGNLERAQAEVMLVLEDRDKVVQAWRAAGFTCWQTRAGDY